MSDTATHSTRKTARFSWLLSVCIIAALTILAGFTIPCFIRSPEKGVMTMQLNNLKQVSLVLKMYREDSETPPKNLPELAAAQKYISQDDWLKIGKFTVGKPLKSSDWLYFPERLADYEAEPILILASPEPLDGFRIVGWSDASCRIISEEEFAAIQSRGGKGKSK